MTSTIAYRVTYSALNGRAIWRRWIYCDSASIDVQAALGRPSRNWTVSDIEPVDAIN